MKNIILALIIHFVSITSMAAVSSKLIDYNKGEFQGYIVTPEKVKANTPAILMIHNWMGVTDETKFQAERFAELGYIVFTADIYGKNIRPKDQKEASTQATKYKTDRKLFRERMNLALDFLKQQKNVDTNKIAALGYCFGGTGVIELARSGAEIKTAVSFHGGLDSPTPADGKNIKAEIVAHHGTIDPYVKAEDIAAFESEMKNNKIKYQLIKYENAVHSFTEKGAGNDNNKGAAYNEAADKKSFEATKQHLKKVL